MKPKKENKRLVEIGTPNDDELHDSIMQSAREYAKKTDKVKYDESVLIVARLTADNLVLRRENKRLMRERDEVRREICCRRAFEDVFRELGPGRSPDEYRARELEIAKERGWDCFESEE